MSEVRDHPAEHRFELAVEDDLAVANYEVADGVITFTHTFVPEPLRGRGLATRLVEAGLRAARAQNWHVVPACPMFLDYVRAHPDTRDLLTADARAALGD